MLKLKLVLIALLCTVTAAHAQKRKKGKTPPAPVAKTDTLKKPETPPNAPKPYKEVITDKAVTTAGMFSVHRIGQKYFFEIPDSLLGRDILVVNRIAKAPTGIRPQTHVYAGDQVAENVISFSKGPDDRIFMKRMLFDEKSGDSSENGMFRAVINSNMQPIVAAFPVKSYGGDSAKGASSVIEVTDLLNTENEIFFFAPEPKKALAIGALQNDKSYISYIRSYPINLEIRTVRTYLKNSAGAPSTLPVTYELNSSMVLLPKVPMKGRYADARVGFFSRYFVDFDAAPQGVKQRGFITRWRLEPREEDREKYLRGELVEPEKPIIYYIDPATPAKWIPYLIAGVNDWQQAFEKAGFKNAIKALPAPANDSTWSIEDARHNVIVYKPSAIANASGPHVHDPRSGEIIETHINWYHNIMQLVHHWYMIQAGAVDPRARKMQFDDALMGELIRFVSSHEVGHTLGLMHNYGSSSTVPVEKLRDKAWVEKHGHTPSIMDYARFNYVAQPEDNISAAGIFPRIGDYDKWAISWGYRWLPAFKSADAEAAYLNKLIIDSLSANKRLFFGSEYEFSDPRSQSEDLGDNAVTASLYGIRNLKRILPQLREWTREPNEGYDALKTMYEEVIRQFRLYNAQVMKSVAGEYRTLKSVEQPGPVYEPVEYSRQKEAMKYLAEQLFKTPTWLVNDTLSALTNVDPFIQVGSAQYTILMKLQGSGTLMALLENEQMYKAQKTYTATEFLNDLKQAVWGELYNNAPIDMYRRNLQKMYVDNYASAFKAVNELVGRNNGNGLVMYINPDPTRNDAGSLVRAHMQALRNDILKAIPAQKGIAKYHLQDMAIRIEYMLKPGTGALPVR